MNRPLLLILLPFFFLFSLSGWTQDRPKIGLVLSGGGAKGFAHIGALKVIEEAGIELDYISGTSMGAIIGGLYASGWCAHQIDSIIQNTDFGAMMVDDLPRSVKPIFEKEYGEKYAISISVKDFKIKLPSAVSNGQNSYNFFNRLTRHVSHIDDFSQLNIPFVAFGTNVVTGEGIVFENGDLARTMRASGAFPGLLAPYEINGQLIIDGGITNNFPAKILREKGMDIVIGVNVEGGLHTKEELSGIDKIIEQVSSFQMVQRSLEQRQYCDLIIYPDVIGFGVADFSDADTLIRRGARAAKIKWDSLVQISGKSGEIKRIVPELYLNKRDSIDIQDLFIIKNPIYTDEKILDFFPTSLPGKISEEDFYESVINLYGTNTFQYVDYYFTKNEVGDNQLVFNPRPKVGYDRLLRLGLHYDNVYKSSLLLNGTFLNLGASNSITSVNVILGDKFRYTANYLVDFGRAPDVGLNSRLDVNTVPVELPVLFLTDTSLQSATFDFDYIDWSNEAYVRFFSNNNQSIGFNGELKFYRTSTDQLLGNNEQRVVGENGVYFTGGIFSKYDSRSNKDFAETGFYSDLKLRYIRPLTSEFFEADDNINSFNLDWKFLKLFKINGNFSLGLSGNIGLLFGEATPPYTYFLGGNNKNFVNNFKPFEGLAYAERFGNNLLSGNFYGQIRPFNNQYARLGVNFAMLSNAYDNFINQQLIKSISASYGVDTPIGPISITYGISNEGQQAYFNLGHWF